MNEIREMHDEVFYKIKAVDIFYTVERLGSSGRPALGLRASSPAEINEGNKCRYNRQELLRNIRQDSRLAALRRRDARVHMAGRPELPETTIPLR